MEQTNKFGEPPSLESQKSVCSLILKSDPDILLFKHWWWLTGKSIPERHNLQTNEQYTRRHWHKLKKAAQECQKILDNPPKIS